MHELCLFSQKFRWLIFHCVFDSISMEMVYVFVFCHFDLMSGKCLLIVIENVRFLKLVNEWRIQIKLHHQHYRILWAFSFSIIFDWNCLVSNIVRCAHTQMCFAIHFRHQIHWNWMKCIWKNNWNKLTMNNVSHYNWVWAKIWHDWKHSKWCRTIN